MKFSFKIQQYQTDAVEAVAQIFQGQPYNAGVSYIRDVGTLQGLNAQLSFLPSMEDGGQLELQDLINDSGFKNESLELTDEQLLHNIQALQNESNIHQSAGLVDPLGRCSLNIEMETGTGKTYVYIKTMEVTADYILNVMIEVNEKKVENAIQKNNRSGWRE